MFKGFQGPGFGVYGLAVQGLGGSVFKGIEGLGLRGLRALEGSECVQEPNMGALIITYVTLGAPYYNYSIIYSTTYSIILKGP